MIRIGCGSGDTLASEATGYGGFANVADAFAAGEVEAAESADEVGECVAAEEVVRVRGDELLFVIVVATPGGLLTIEGDELVGVMLLFLLQW